MTPRGSDRSAPTTAGSIDTVSPTLNVHRFGPPGPPRILAIHGLTGHGLRWQALATRQLSEVPIAAPDLLGHGRSSAAAPWTIDANSAALATLLDDVCSGPVVLVGHSFGGAIALHLAATRPDVVAGLVLLDPAVGLDGSWMHDIAHAMLDSPDYTDRDEARSEKAYGSWADVPAEDLDAELDQHLITLPSGRVGWRIDVAAMMSYWSELARPVTLPAVGIPTTLIRATWTSPPYVTEDLIDGLRERLGARFRLVDVDCDHMVAQAKPAETASEIRRYLTTG